MKRIFIFLLVLIVGRGFSQSTIFYDDYTNAIAPVTFSNSTDWTIENGFYPTCNVVSSSGAHKLIAQPIGITSGTVEEAVYHGINTGTFVNIVVQWNQIKGSSLSPTMTFEWSRDAGATWTAVPFTAPTTTNVWTAVPTITLPATANATLISVRFSYTTTGGFGVDYLGIDDFKVSGTPSPSYYWNGSGPLHDPTAWGINTNGTGGGLSDFSTANQNLFLRNASAATLTAAWNITGAGSVLNIGDGTVPNAFDLTIPAGFSLGISGGAKVNVSNNSTLTIINTSFPSLSSVDLGASSTINFAQTSNVSIWATTYGNLTFSGSGSRAPGASIVVNGAFVVGASNTYAMPNGVSFTTRLSGRIACSGSITTGVSNLTIDGVSTNTIGTLNFNGTTINNLVLNRPTQTLTLGSNLIIQGAGVSGTSIFTDGNLNLNGRSLTFNGPITFPASTSNGVFIGSSTSSLVIAGTGAIANSLLMSQASAAARTTAFTFSRTGGVTLSLGNDLIVQAGVFSNGFLNLNGRLLTLNGALTLPTGTANGYFIGSSSSSISIAGSGAITNSLFMDQTSGSSRSLGLLNLTRNGVTLPLGNNLVVSGLTDLPNSVIDINGTLLTLSGPINFPTSAFTRGFRGSLTSSLTIDGTGAMTGELYMNTTIQLDNLTMNRSGQTLTLGNTLETYNVINALGGTLASGGNLFIRANATNKGRIAPVTGVISGNIKTESFAAGGNTDWTNLGPAGVSGLTVANWEGQIPMTCSLCPNDQTSAGGYFVSIQRWDATKLAADPAAYVEMTYNTALNPAQGYWVFLGTGLGTTPAMTWTVSGPAITGNVSIPLACPVPMDINENFNLISNPYPSPISWTSLRNGNANVDNAIYVYSPDAGGNTYFAGGVSSDPVNGITDIIPMGQGFYVQAINPATLTAQESNKVSGNNPLLKTTEDVGAVVRLRVDDASGFYDMTALRFHGDATPDFDRELDANKIFASPGYLGYPGPYTQRTSISTKSGNRDYAINSLPYAQSADAVIPVLVKAYASGQHTITGSDLQNLPNSCVILKDKVTNTTHDLKTGPYVCNINDTTSTPRFELRVCMDIAMSVDDSKNKALDQSIFISNDENGVYVKFAYDKATKSKISVTNILGQKVIDDRTLTTVDDKVYLNLDQKQQLVFVTVSTDTQKVTKKIVR